MGPWKGIRKGLNGPLELYNLDDDLGERRNLAADKPDIAATLARLMREARTESEFWPVRERA
jgi:arylsulfatase A-like enzyme